MQNKGQITMFIILGFIIITAAGFIYYLSKTTTTEKIKIEAEKSAKISFSLDNMNNFLNNCFKNLASEGVDYVSLRGGVLHSA